MPSPVLFRKGLKASNQSKCKLNQFRIKMIKCTTSGPKWSKCKLYRSIPSRFLLVALKERCQVTSPKSVKLMPRLYNWIVHRIVPSPNNCSSTNARCFTVICSITTTRSMYVHTPPRKSIVAWRTHCRAKKRKRLLPANLAGVRYNLLSRLPKVQT